MIEVTSIHSYQFGSHHVVGDNSFRTKSLELPTFFPEDKDRILEYITTIQNRYKTLPINFIDIQNYWKLELKFPSPPTGNIITQYSSDRSMIGVFVYEGKEFEEVCRVVRAKYYKDIPILSIKDVENVLNNNPPKVISHSYDRLGSL